MSEFDKLASKLLKEARIDFDQDKMEFSKPIPEEGDLDTPHPVPFYNLPEDLQEKLEKKYGMNYVDYLKSLDQEELDIQVRERAPWYFDK